MSAGDGTRAVVAAELRDLLDAPEDQQLALLPLNYGDGARGDQAREAVRRHRAGRPEGARNLATRQMLDFVRKVLGDPMLERARMTMHTPHTLARELSCTPLEAAEFIDKIRADLSRFFYAPLAPVNDQGQTVAPIFAINAPGGQVGIAAPGRMPWEGEWNGYQETQQNQALPKSDGAVSDGTVSDETAKGLKG